MADLLERLKAALADRYRIEQELGLGGMATVYLAQDLKQAIPTPTCSAMNTHRSLAAPLQPVSRVRVRPGWLQGYLRRRSGA